MFFKLLLTKFASVTDLYASMNGQPLISIIVPVYNAERTLEACVESLFNQSYPCIEYIFVDDGSADGSLALLERLIALSSCGKSCKIIRSDKNKGSACARASAIDEATGEWLMFCDSDDRTEPEMASRMMAAADKPDVDIVTTSYYADSPDSSRVISYSATDTAELNEAPIDTLHFSLWNKLIRASLIKSNRLHGFTSAKCWDDLAIVAPALALAGKVVVMHEAYYHYTCSDVSASLTHRSHDIRLEDHLQVAEYLVYWFEERGLSERYAPFLKRLKFTSKIKMLRGRRIDVARWKSTYPESNRGILGYRHIALRYRIAFFAVSVLPTCISQGIARLLGRNRG